MVFRKKGRMIDVRELQRRGVVRIPKDEVDSNVDSDGFVEMGAGEKNNSGTNKESSANFFGFMDNSTNTKSDNDFTSEKNGYNRREVDAKITELDNKIYRLENRLEVLEKKLNVNQSSQSSIGPMGW